MAFHLVLTNQSGASKHLLTVVPQSSGIQIVSADEGPGKYLDNKVHNLTLIQERNLQLPTLNTSLMNSTVSASSIR